MVTVLLKTPEVIFHTDCGSGFMYAAWKPGYSKVPAVLHLAQDKNEFCWVDFDKLISNQFTAKKFFPQIAIALETVLQAGFSIFQFDNLMDLIEWTKTVSEKNPSTQPEQPVVTEPSNSEASPKNLKKSLGNSKPDSVEESK